jgi:hypothetical protein
MPGRLRIKSWHTACFAASGLVVAGLVALPGDCRKAGSALPELLAHEVLSLCGSDGDPGFIQPYSKVRPTSVLMNECHVNPIKRADGFRPAH